MKKIILFLAILSVGCANSQTNEESKSIPEINQNDFSDLLTSDSLSNPAFGENINYKKTEPFGIIGKDYQRFYIHFISVIQNPNNKVEYFVYGKTMTKRNICDFQGTLTINESFYSEKSVEPELSKYKRGTVKGEYSFFEDHDQKGSGFFKGKFQIDFYKNEKGNIKYDCLMNGADGFTNNQFIGLWTSYKTNESKKCNWGDYRIPDCGDLDIGAAYFIPKRGNIDDGWENYRFACGYNGTEDIQKITEAEKKENEKWWIVN